MSNAPPFTLPPFKGSTVRVSLLDGGRFPIVPMSLLVQPDIPGFEYTLDLPSYSFLVENEKLGKKLLFDLGIMKSFKEKAPPEWVRLFQGGNSEGAAIVPDDIADVLTANSIPLASINHIFWSHHHFDHTGDPSTFPKSTSLVVGPGFKAHPQMYPGYPENPLSLTVQDAFEGRELIELDFSESTLKVYDLRAIDWFGDGSFYILEATGHTASHIMGLARTSEDKFILFGGDSCHHAGEFRPNTHTPLPDSITPHPWDLGRAVAPCPGAIFEQIHPFARDPETYKTTPFYHPATIMCSDAVAWNHTFEALKALDASPDVLVIVSHDTSLVDVLDYYPKAELNGWEAGDLNKKAIGRWRFLKYFREAIEKKAEEKKVTSQL